MASLALMVCIIFFLSLFIGPLVLLISKIEFVPTWIIWILGLFSIAVGFWWLLLPIPFGTKLVSVICIGLGFMAIYKRYYYW